jgi:hypothetical protein
LMVVLLAAVARIYKQLGPSYYLAEIFDQ